MSHVNTTQFEFLPRHDFCKYTWVGIQSLLQDKVESESTKPIRQASLPYFTLVVYSL
jgi:hypothetical protein